MPLTLIHALAVAKHAAASANEMLGLLDATLASAIREAAQEVSSTITSCCLPVRFHPIMRRTANHGTFNRVIKGLVSELSRDLRW